jgi:transcription antitermination factor NusG
MRSEKLVARLLEEKSYEVYLPWGRAVSSARLSGGEGPLFPGYLFCRDSHPHHDGLMVTTPGVVHLVGFGHGPTLMSDAEVQALKRMVDSGLPLRTAGEIYDGEMVYIAEGPLRGLEAQMIRNKGGCRAVVSISQIKRSISVEIDCNWMRPLGPSVALPSEKKVG